MRHVINTNETVSLTVRMKLSSALLFSLADTNSPPTAMTKSLHVVQQICWESAVIAELELQHVGELSLQHTCIQLPFRHACMLHSGGCF